MVKIIRNTSNTEELDKLSKRKVCNVEEFELETLLGPAKFWKGSTEEEYFTLLFTNGMLTLCFNEREMLLDQDPVGVGMVAELREAVDVSKTDEAKGLELTQAYTGGPKFEGDVKNITFGDALEVLGWEMKDGAKIMFDNFLS